MSISQIFNEDSPRLGGVAPKRSRYMNLGKLDSAAQLLPRIHPFLMVSRQGRAFVEDSLECSPICRLHTCEMRTQSSRSHLTSRARDVAELGRNQLGQGTPRPTDGVPSLMKPGEIAPQVDSVGVGGNRHGQEGLRLKPMPELLNLDGLGAVNEFVEDWLHLDLLRPARQYLWWIFKQDRKGAGVVSREFLEWLSRRRQPEQPFFAFLNYYDAHAPYEVPTTGINRFRVKPRSRREMRLLEQWLPMTQRKLSESEINLGRDCYDDCVANLDEELGRLIDELDRRSVLERSWVIITSDHGESFGEKPGIFWHGTSLYETQLHVPLVIIPPAGGPSPRVITETVSLRELAATIVDIPDFKAAAPFPGKSLARFWNGSALASAKAPASGQALSELVPLPYSARHPSGGTHEPEWPLAALTEGDWTYIRRAVEVREELFRVREDARQQHNLANDPAMRPTLDRMRRALDELTAGPLTPERFNP
jgi:arylsulfatase A-like enzyme